MSIQTKVSREPVYEVSMYDPKTETRAFFVVDTLQSGMAGGGIRMSPHVTLDEVRRLAKAMTYKFSAVKVPAGGAKAGIVGDPNSPDKNDRLVAFAKMMEPFLKTLYVPGEDMGTTAQDLALIYRVIDYSWVRLAKENALKQGFELPLPDDFNPSAAGGEDLEKVLTGHGLAEVTQEACNLLDMKPEKTKISIQGFGTVGGMTALFLAQKGFTVVSVADVKGTLFAPQGLPIDTLLESTDKTGTIDRSKLAFEHQALHRDDWLTVDADILIPAAVPDTIHRDNADRIKATLVVQGANIPVTSEAEDVLFRKGIATVPDFIANAGAAGGLGMLLTGQVPLDPGMILEAVGQRLRETTREVLTVSREGRIRPRDAAIRLAEAGLKDADPFL